jgi:AcrR family transcriptional regulator
VHHHFGSKDGLWRAAIDHLFANVPPVLAQRDGAREPAGPADPISRALARFVRLSAEHPEIARIIAREGAAPSPRLTYLVEHHVGAMFKLATSQIRGAQRAGAIARDLDPGLLLFLVLGAGGHLFDVPALAKHTLGIDVRSEATRDAFVALFARVLRDGILAR